MMLQSFKLIIACLLFHIYDLRAQENSTDIAITVINDDVIPTTVKYSSTELVTKVSRRVTTFQSDSERNTANISENTTTKEEPNVETQPSERMSTQSLIHTTLEKVDAKTQESGNNIYILIGAGCVGFLALIIFTILFIYIFKRCRRNDYTKGHSKPQYDDEKGDISGPQWVFNDDRPDWIYDGADDDENNEYVGPLPGKTGKRTSLMDKRYVHDSESFGRKKPSGDIKRSPVEDDDDTAGGMPEQLYINGPTDMALSRSNIDDDNVVNNIDEINGTNEETQMYR